MKKTRKTGVVVAVLVAFALAFLWGRIVDASEVRLGMGFGYNHNGRARYQEVMVTDSHRNWYIAATKIGGDAKHNYQYWRYTGGYRVNFRKDRKASPFMRLGVAYFNEAPTDYISDNLAFDLAVGVRLWSLVEIEFDQHNSTGGRSDENEGLDALMISMVFPF